VTRASARSPRSSLVSASLDSPQRHEH
jgi:hypothetical protein